MVEFSILGGAWRQNSKTATLDFRRADSDLFRRLIGAVPWRSVLANKGVQDGWSLLKKEVLKAQERVVPLSRKMSRWRRRPAWMNRELFLRLREKKGIYRLWKEGRATQNDYKEAVKMSSAGKQTEPPVILEEAVRELLLQLDCHKSMGPDEIHPRVLKELAEVIAEPLSVIFQCSLLTACVFCGQVDADSGILGRKKWMVGFYVHEFCAAFTNGLCGRNRGNSRMMFLVKDLGCTVREAEQRLCFVCGSSRASITCAEPGCERSFHLPCAYEGQCVTQYFGEFRAFCWEHRPQQAAQAAPEPDTTCIICMEPVGDSRSYGTMVCPACQQAWFHRACIQRMALCSERRSFQCPNCRDAKAFHRDLLTVGIRIPERMPTRDDTNAYAALAVWHRRCVASDCLYPHGRARSGEGPWELLLCSSCAARGTHRRCAYLSDSTTGWECNACAGEGTASSTGSGLAGLDTTSQQELQTSQSSVTPESGSSDTTSQAPSEPANRSSVPESSSLSSQRRPEWRRLCWRLHRMDDSCQESQGCCGSTHNAALRASQGTSRSSRHCPALGYNLRCRQGQRARTRSRSPLQRRAPASPSRPQRHRGSRQRASPGAQSCTRSYATPAAPGSSRASTTAHGSPSRHPGRARTRSRSPLRRRAAETDSQPRRRRTSRARRRGPAQGRSRSREPRRDQRITSRPC
ncbi:uncharacterized protein [Excalfactoria chinensis]|uniref:uncharacterized protein n=1 Tax=Excalfactoria chinensis TaxID=46218 RepID=UPI003B3B69FE